MTSTERRSPSWPLTEPITNLHSTLDILAAGPRNRVTDCKHVDLVRAASVAEWRLRAYCYERRQLVFTSL
jgi:hypothetical protein